MIVVSNQARILTNKGYKLPNALTYNTRVAQFNRFGNIVFTDIDKIHRYDSHYENVSVVFPNDNKYSLPLLVSSDDDTVKSELPVMKDKLQFETIKEIEISNETSGRRSIKIAPIENEYKVLLAGHRYVRNSSTYINFDGDCYLTILEILLWVNDFKDISEIHTVRTYTKDMSVSEFLQFRKSLKELLYKSTCIEYGIKTKTTASFRNRRVSMTVNIWNINDNYIPYDLSTIDLESIDFSSLHKITHAIAMVHSHGCNFYTDINKTRTVRALYTVSGTATTLRRYSKGFRIVAHDRPYLQVTDIKRAKKTKRIRISVPLENTIKLPE